MKKRTLFPRIFPSLAIIAVGSTLGFGQSNVQTSPAPSNAGSAVVAPGPAAPNGATTTTVTSAKPNERGNKAEKTVTPSTQPSEEKGEGTTKPEGDTPEATPSTVILDHESGAGSGAKTNDDGDLFPVPALPKGDVSLIGGVVRSIDHVRDRLTVQPFGGKSMKFRMDERTHIYRDGVETTQLGINKGERVYVDSMLDKAGILARNVHVVTQTQTADARGQLLGWRDKNQTMVVQDQLSGQPVRFRIDNSTSIKKLGSAGSVGDLQPGALIEVQFAPDKVNRGLARVIDVFAVPGVLYQFAGDVTFLNLATGVMAVHNQSDDKSYEIGFRPASVPNINDLVIGSTVNLHAEFTGRRYEARDVNILKSAAAKDKEQ